jgi:hypothetical protein
VYEKASLSPSHKVTGNSNTPVLDEDFQYTASGTPLTVRLDRFYTMDEARHAPEPLLHDAARSVREGPFADCKDVPRRVLDARGLPNRPTS